MLASSRQQRRNANSFKLLEDRQIKLSDRRRTCKNLESATCLSNWRCTTTTASMPAARAKATTTCTSNSKYSKYSTHTHSNTNASACWPNGACRTKTLSHATCQRRRHCSFGQRSDTNLAESKEDTLFPEPNPINIRIPPPLATTSPSASPSPYHQHHHHHHPRQEPRHCRHLFRVLKGCIKAFIIRFDSIFYSLTL